MRVAVVGSGAAGIAAATALLDAGLEVEMLDVGHVPDAASAALAERIRATIDAGEGPDRTLRSALKRPAGPHGTLARGLKALLGGGVEASRIEKRVLGSGFVFEDTERGIPITPLRIPRSLARGGLSNVWGAACYAWRSDDWNAWPLERKEIEHFYPAAAELLGLVEHRDDLARAYPLWSRGEPAVGRNPGSAAEHLLAHWSERSAELAAAGFAAGRARLAVRTPGAEGDACRRCGLCVYGCPFDSIYSARRTLAALEREPRFRYLPDHFVLSFHEDGAGLRVRARRATGERVERRADALFLAAGTLSSLRIAADSLGEHGRSVPLLDNDMRLLPLISTCGVVGGRFRSRFTLAEAVLSLEPGVVAQRALHLQIYPFHEYFLAELGELLARLPRAFANLVWWPLNNLLVSFTYTAGSESRIARGRVRRDGEVGCVEIEQRMHPESGAIAHRLSRHLWRNRRALGFYAVPMLGKLTPLGFSGHLAGSLPMRRAPGPLESHLDGRLHGTRRVYVVDASGFPDLPAQNLTYTIAANAMRVATGFAAAKER